MKRIEKSLVSMILVANLKKPFFSLLNWAVYLFNTSLESRKEQPWTMENDVLILVWFDDLFV